MRYHHTEVIPFSFRRADHFQLPALHALHLGDKGLGGQVWVRWVLSEGNTGSRGELGIALQGGPNTGQFLLYAFEGVLLGPRTKSYEEQQRALRWRLAWMVALPQASSQPVLLFMFLYKCVLSYICRAGLYVCSRVQVLDVSIELKQFQLWRAELQ